MKGYKKWLVVHAALLPVVLLLVAIVLEALGVLPAGAARRIGQLLSEAAAELPDALLQEGRPSGSNWSSPEAIRWLALN